MQTHPRGLAFTQTAFSIPHTHTRSSRPAVSADSGDVCWRRGAEQLQAGQTRVRAAQIDWISWLKSISSSPKLFMRDGFFLLFFQSLGRVVYIKCIYFIYLRSSTFKSTSSPKNVLKIIIVFEQVPVTFSCLGECCNTVLLWSMGENR